jgi:hypothetical protein
MGGKTRTGAGWVHQRALQYPKRWIAIVARTPADARDHMIEGPGGLLRNTHPLGLADPLVRRSCGVQFSNTDRRCTRRSSAFVFQISKTRHDEPHRTNKA